MRLDIGRGERAYVAAIGLSDMELDSLPREPLQFSLRDCGFHGQRGQRRVLVAGSFPDTDTKLQAWAASMGFRYVVALDERRRDKLRRGMSHVFRPDAKDRLFMLAYLCHGSVSIHNTIARGVEHAVNIVAAETKR